LPSKLPGKDTSAHFENEDLNLFLHIDRAGNARATAIPKTKTIGIKAFEHTSVYNDIVKKDEAKTTVRSDLQIKTSVATKHTQKESAGNTSISFSLIMVLLLACVVIWIARKLTFWRRLFG
jgi:hypothetical protein